MPELKKIRCVAIDDEPIALAILGQFCARRGGMELETFTNPSLGLQRIKATRPDLVFLDIELGCTSGVALAKELPKECILVFTTAYAQYALDGFEVNAIDFLHKPFFYNRFERAMQKVEERIKMDMMLSLSESPERQIMLKVQYKDTAVSIDDILYVETMDNYVKVHRVNKSAILSLITLKILMSMLPEREFVRVHRSFVVAVNKVSRFNRQQVFLTDNSVLPMGRIYAEKAVDVLRRQAPESAHADGQP